MTEEQSARLRLFLVELTQLSTKYKIVIDGCGCCGSPYLSDLNKAKPSWGRRRSFADDLEWNEEQAAYTCQ